MEIYWRETFGSFMISGPTLSSSHWLDLFTQNPTMTSFYNVPGQHLFLLMPVLE